MAQWSKWPKFVSLHYWHAPRCPRVSKNQLFLQIKLFSSCAKIDQKMDNFLKNRQNWKKIIKKRCFLKVFRRFFNFGSILVHQTSNGVFSGCWRIFWHPLDTWGRINSGDTVVSRFVFDICVPQRHLAIFFILFKLQPDITFIYLTIKSDNITF